MGSQTTIPQVSSGPSSGNLSSDQKVYALEQKVAALEAQVAALVSVLTVSSNGTKATLKAETVEIESLMDMKLTANLRMTAKAGTRLKMEAGTEAVLKCASNMLLESGGLTDLKSANLLKIKGAIVKVNDGATSVARQNDPVAGNKILMGSLNFFA